MITSEEYLREVTIGELKPLNGTVFLFSAGCEETGRMAAFRDLLRESGGERLRYEGAKRELAARTWKHLQHYADAKTDVVREILAGRRS